jgi:hypothetical protein
MVRASHLLEERKSYSPTATIRVGIAVAEHVFASKATTLRVYSGTMSVMMMPITSPTESKKRYLTPLLK